MMSDREKGSFKCIPDVLPNMYVVRSRPPIVNRRQISPGNLDWKRKWPFLLSTMIAVIIIVFSLIIFALEIASLAKFTTKYEYNGHTYGNTASTGAGIWCGFFIFTAGMLILAIDCVRRIRQWATTALFATILAACFTIVLIGLDAKAVKDGRDLSDITQMLTGSSYFDPKFRILAAQLAFACLVFLLCIAFIILYIIVLIIPPKVLRPLGVGPSLRY